MNISNNKLNNLRKEIDLIDDQLLQTLAKRLKIVSEIGLYKKELKLPALDKKRWNEVLETRIKLGKKLRLSEKLVKKIFEAIHEEALIVEEKVKL